MTLTSSKIGKVLPTPTALEVARDSEAPRSVVVEIVSSHPEATKRTVLSNFSRELFELSKKQDLVIVVSPKPEPKKS